MAETKDLFLELPFRIFEIYQNSVRKMSQASEFWLTKNNDVQAKSGLPESGLGVQVSSLERRFGNTYLTVTDAGNVSATVTAASVVQGILTSNPGAAITLTLPTAALLVAADLDAALGRGYNFSIINTNGSNVITVAGGTGVTLVGLATVATNSTASFYVRYDAVGTPAISVYRL